MAGSRPDAATAEIVPPSWRDMAVVMATATLAGASFAMLGPLTTLVMDAAGWSKLLIGANAAMHGLGIFLVAPLVSVLLHRLRATGSMQLALWVAVLGTLALPLSIEPATWFPLRLVVGAAAGLLFVISEASVNAMAPEASRGRIIGLYATLFSLGYAAGPLVVAIAGHEGWSPFLLAGAILLVGLVPARLAGAADRALGERERPHGGVLGTLTRTPLPIATILVFGMVEAAFFALLPLWGLAVGLTERLSAVLLTVWIAGNIVLQIPIGWLGDRIGRRRVLALCLVVASVALIALHHLAAAPAALWGLLALAGAAMGALYTLSLALLGQAFRGPEQAAANTAFIVTFEVGVVLGPALGGVATHLLGAEALLLTTVIPMLLLLLALPRLRSPGA